MADYHTPTVVEPLIPACDVTPLEQLLLEDVFEVDEENDGLYLCHPIGTNDYPEAGRAALERALAESRGFDSRINAHVAATLAATPTADPVLIELNGVEACPDMILQDIVRRSPTLRYVTVTCAFTCSKMRMDGFGGAVTLITPDAIVGKSTSDVLGELMVQAGVADT